MNDEIKNLLESVRRGEVSVDEAYLKLRTAPFRDLGFVARADGAFDVYCCGGLGNNPKMGVRVASAIAPSRVLYYVEAMIRLFIAYGDYTNRSRARTRYLQDTLGENLKSEFFIPLMVDKLINDGTATVEVLDTTSKWFGVTYPEDRQSVVDKIQALVDAGEYPAKLF